MNKTEAIQLAKDFLFTKTGKVGEPEMVKLIEKPERPSTWLVVFGAELFFAEELSRGDVIDGGEYCLFIDNLISEITVM